MIFLFGGRGGKELRNTELSEDSVGDVDVIAMMCELIAEGRPAVWLLTKPVAKEGVTVQEHDCRVGEGDTQSMSSAKAEDNPPPPFYALDTPWDQTPDVDADGIQRKTKGGTLKFGMGYAG